jgi:hypothetical protein
VSALQLFLADDVAVVREGLNAGNQRVAELRSVVISLGKFVFETTSIH